jgi:hypothetical protein
MNHPVVFDCFVSCDQWNRLNLYEKKKIQQFLQKLIENQLNLYPEQIARISSRYFFKQLNNIIETDLSITEPQYHISRPNRNFILLGLNILDTIQPHDDDCEIHKLKQTLDSTKNYITVSQRKTIKEMLFPFLFFNELSQNDYKRFMTQIGFNELSDDVIFFSILMNGYTVRDDIVSLCRASGASSLSANFGCKKLIIESIESEEQFRKNLSANFDVKDLTIDHCWKVFLFRSIKEIPNVKFDNIGLFG